METLLNCNEINNRISLIFTTFLRSFFFYTAVHDLLADDLSSNLIDHDSKKCIVCSPEAFSSEDEVGLYFFYVQLK